MLRDENLLHKANIDTGENMFYASLVKKWQL